MNTRPWITNHTPASALIITEGPKRIGAVVRGEEVFLYYASPDTRCHVTTPILFPKKILH